MGAVWSDIEWQGFCLCHWKLVPFNIQTTSDHLKSKGVVFELPLFKTSREDLEIKDRLGYFRVENSVPGFKLLCVAMG